MPTASDSQPTARSSQSEPRTQLIGHTALCIISLLGFFIYSASYSIVYRLNHAASGKPVAVLEMWMVLTHLLSSVLTCLLQALLTLSASECQTAVFLAVALAVTIISMGCLQDDTQCTAFFPAATWPSVAGMGATAWAWVVYVASLGCQNSLITLGLSQGLVAVACLALFPPLVINALKQTCNVHSLCQQQLLGCDTGLPVHLTLWTLALLLWYSAGFTPLTIQLQVLSIVLVLLDGILVLPTASAGP